MIINNIIIKPNVRTSLTEVIIYIVLIFQWLYIGIFVYNDYFSLWIMLQSIKIR